MTNHPNRKMNKTQKVAKVEGLLDSLERRLDRCNAGDSEKVIKLSKQWDDANDRLADLQS